jgi:hypothetical protein
MDQIKDIVMPSLSWIEITRLHLHPRMDERNDALNAELRAMQSEHNAKGMYGSGAFLSTVSNLAAGEIKVRVRIATATAIRAIREVGAKSGEDLNHSIAEEVRIHAHEALNAVTQVAGPFISHFDGVLAGYFATEVGKARQRAIELEAGEIAMFTRRREADASRRDTNSRDVVLNITGPVGSIQTGDGASANVVQHLAAEDREMVVHALQSVREFIERSQEKRPDLVEVVNDAEHEVRKDRPNAVKLKSLLIGIATYIQGLASAQGAYQAITNVLDALRIGF